MNERSVDSLFAESFASKYCLESLKKVIRFCLQRIVLEKKISLVLVHRMKSQ